MEIVCASYTVIGRRRTGGTPNLLYASELWPKNRRLEQHLHMPLQWRYTMEMKAQLQSSICPWMTLSNGIDQNYINCASEKAGFR